MLPNLSVLWVIFFILVLTFVVDRLPRPVLGVAARRSWRRRARKPRRRSPTPRAGSMPRRATRRRVWSAAASAAKENAGEESEKGSGWSATIAKAFNFAILVEMLV